MMCIEFWQGKGRKTLAFHDSLFQVLLSLSYSQTNPNPCILQPTISQILAFSLLPHTRREPVCPSPTSMSHPPMRSHGLIPHIIMWPPSSYHQVITRVLSDENHLRSCLANIPSIPNWTFCFYFVNSQHNRYPIKFSTSHSIFIASNLVLSIVIDSQSQFIFTDTNVKIQM